MSEMNDNNTIRAKKYRALAEQIRVIAEDIRGDDYRRVLLKVAKDYERMALRVEAIALTASANFTPPRRLRSG
jgi:hypothetical protein